MILCKAAAVDCNRRCNLTSPYNSAAAAESLRAQMRRKRPHQPSSVEVDWSRPGLPPFPAWRLERPRYQAPAVAVDWSARGLPSLSLWPLKQIQPSVGELLVDWSTIGLQSASRGGGGRFRFVATMRTLQQNMQRLCGRFFRR